MDDSTLISNLPDNRRNGDRAQNPSLQVVNNNNNEISTNAYIPMNVHNNPYGFNNNIEISQHPQETVQRLPSRDIPSDQTKYTQDQVVKANYIEEPKNIQDYIQDYKEEESSRIRKHN
jgi:hypothetical protein